MSRQARPRLTLMHDEGVLGVDVTMLGEQGMKTKEIRQSYMGLNIPETRYSIESKKRGPTRTWMMGTTLNTNARLAPGRALICVHG